MAQETLNFVKDLRAKQQQGGSIPGGHHSALHGVPGTPKVLAVISQATHNGCFKALGKSWQWRTTSFKSMLEYRCRLPASHSSGNRLGSQLGTPRSPKSPGANAQTPGDLQSASSRLSWLSRNPAGPARSCSPCRSRSSHLWERMSFPVPPWRRRPHPPQHHGPAALHARTSARACTPGAGRG